MFFGNYKRNQERAFRLAGMFGGKISEQYTMVSLFRTSTHCVEGVSKSVKYRIDVSAIGLNLMMYEFCLPDGIFCSLNRPYQPMMVEKPATDSFPEYGMPVYVSNLLGDLPPLKRFLKDGFTLSTIQEMRLLQKERLFVGQMQLSLWHNSKDDDFFNKRFNDALSLIMHHAIETPSAAPDTITSRYADSRGVIIDQKNIPKGLRTLLPLAKKWAIGNDVERQRYMDSVSANERKALVDAVTGLRDEIEQWTMQHRKDTPVPDEVVLFDMMSEAAAEAETEFLR